MLWGKVKVGYAKEFMEKALSGASQPFAICGSLLHQNKRGLDKMLLKFQEHDVARSGLYHSAKMINITCNKGKSTKYGSSANLFI